MPRRASSRGVYQRHLRVLSQPQADDGNNRVFKDTFCIFFFFSISPFLRLSPAKIVGWSCRMRIVSMSIKILQCFVDSPCRPEKHRCRLILCLAVRVLLCCSRLACPGASDGLACFCSPLCTAVVGAGWCYSITPKSEAAHKVSTPIPKRLKWTPSCTVSSTLKSSSTYHILYVPDYLFLKSERGK